ncbi:MAG: hypothetical protein Q9184_005019, partial [Pyrenodesmia sp. 2 TL-2023]
GKDVDLIYAQLKCFFKQVDVAKPRSSRASSLEAFVVCRGFFGSAEGREAGSETVGKAPATKRDECAENTADEDEWVDGQRRTERDDGITVLEFQEDEQDDRRWIAPFVACGDLSAWDSDATYHLPKDRVSLDPVQPPTAPPYKRALEIRKQQGGAYGKTGKGSDGIFIDDAYYASLSATVLIIDLPYSLAYFIPPTETALVEYREPRALGI